MQVHDGIQNHGLLVPFQFDGTAAEFYSYNNPAGSSWNGAVVSAVADRSHIFFVDAEEGLSLVVVHDRSNDNDGGRADMSFILSDDPDGMTLVVEDDPGDTYRGSCNEYTTVHRWNTCCTDGLVFSGMDPGSSVEVGFSTTRNLNRWVAYSADGTTLELDFKRKYHFRALHDGQAEAFCNDQDPENDCEDPAICRCTDDNLEVAFEGDLFHNAFEYGRFTPGMKIPSVVVMNTVSPLMQGWSFAVAHDASKLSLSAEDLTLVGTDAEAHSGPLPFIANEIITTEQPDGTILSGYISVLVLNVPPDVVLPVQRNTLIRASYELKEDVGEDGTLLRIVDNKLASPNSPVVAINLTNDGKPRLPRLLTHAVVRKKPPRSFHIVDLLDSELAHNIELFGIGTDLCIADLDGFVGVERTCEYIDDKTGLRTVDTRVVKLDLRGRDPNCGLITISLQSDRASTGKVVAKQSDSLFPADSHFDVFIKVSIPDLGLTLMNCEAATMRCMVDSLPPIGCTYQIGLDGGDFDVALYPEGVDCKRIVVPVGRITAADHTPMAEPPCEAAMTIPFIRGDCNADGEVCGSVTDALYLFNFLFVGGPDPACHAACDSNGDVKVDTSDGIYVLNYCFASSGPAPPAPYPDCGNDLTCLRCESYHCDN